MNLHERVSQTGAMQSGIEKEVYYSPEVAELEKQRLWPRVWQVACREEELPDVGSYVTYDILDDSVIVVRTSEHEIKAYNNACRHRGRRLTTDCGHAKTFVCRFHGWKWKLNGENYDITDREDFGNLDPAELSLLEFKVGRWGGFVFINMDPDSVSFDEYIAPVKQYLDPMEFEKQRYRWYISVEVEANWKDCQEAFMESYHVAYTHPKLEPVIDSRSYSRAVGDQGHGQLRFRKGPDQVIGYHFGGKSDRDGRDAAFESIRQQARDIDSIFSDRDVQAAARILTELPEGTGYQEALGAAVGYMREAAIAAGAGFPEMTEEQAYEAGFDWMIFPNTVNVLSPTGGLWYRSRPMRDNNPDKCVFEMYALERFTPGSEPKVEKKHFPNWQDFLDLPPFLIPDFINIPEVHRGIKTRGFTGPNFNPIQEAMIANFHHVLRRYIDS
ncbi:aromatic ring-hydroxylating oxygenase subunit alpha [Sphingosinicella soli]|uniref:Phenylpropionate dioxygenase-like ring-hydroxylating dioxygenase large terminal subunit n=1 Tax=Sphingosinicella soli TaxID=333708 RepID=A0A7W7B4L0_9SPHN|nr:aromatic ring-hydroxylating dioxygenase subunit alpha [Sphingosinicella soli]MBB4633835.1 phenylpropionate dioxygenase-like ring-hydroxylating dioxygenase large terminal subunit [Sphingosinicella soli]